VAWSLYTMDINEENKLKEVNFAAPQEAAYIKLMKNTKGYNWDFKVLTTDVTVVEKLNNELLTKFGDQLE